MRLSNDYISVFNNAITKFLPISAKAELRLYGSRTDDLLKGGDIDLLLITNTAETANYLKRHKPQIFGNIFLTIDEQKIDLLIVDATTAKTEPFAKKAYENSILLKRWDLQ